MNNNDGRVLKYYIQVHTLLNSAEPVIIRIPDINMKVSQFEELVLNSCKQQSVDLSLSTLDNKPIIRLLNIEINQEENMDKTLQELELPLQSLLIDEEKEAQESYTIIRNATHLFVKNERSMELYHTLCNFRNNQFEAQKSSDDNLKRLTLPKTLTSVDRKFVHGICEQLELHHQSIGSKDSRQMVISYRKSVGKNNGAKVKDAVSTETRQSKTKIPKGMSEVIPGFLYLGSGRDANDMDQLTANKITHILNCTVEWPAYHALPEHMTLKRISIKDLNNVNIVEQFAECHSYIEQVKQSGGRVFVHCTIGRSRSASIVLSYLMKGQGMNLGQAYTHLFKCRDIVKPNDGFMKQLMTYEHELYDGQYTDKENMISKTLEWVFTEVPAPTEEELEKQRQEKREMQERMEKDAEQLVSDQELSNIVQNDLAGKLESEGIGSFIQRVMKVFSDKIKQHPNEKLLRAAVGKRVKAWYTTHVEQQNLLQE